MDYINGGKCCCAGKFSITSFNKINCTYIYHLHICGVWMTHYRCNEQLHVQANDIQLHWHSISPNAISQHEKSYVFKLRIQNISVRLLIPIPFRSLALPPIWLGNRIRFACKSCLFAENLNFHVDVMQQPVDSHGVCTPNKMLTIYAFSVCEKTERRSPSVRDYGNRAKATEEICKLTTTMMTE